MTQSVDQSAKPTLSSAALERYREKVSYDVDWRLDDMLNFIFGIDDESLEATSSFTLLTAGGVIEGMAVNRKKYASSQRDSVAEKSPELAEGMRIVDEALEKVIVERRASEPNASRRYIHFLEATVTNGTARHAVKQLRVDLKDVIGWSLMVNTA